LTSVVVVAAVVFASGISYNRYFAQAAPLHYALGLLVVLLAVPLARQFAVIRAARLPLAAALLVGSLTALTTAIAFPVFLQAPVELIASLAPKSTTAAVAVGIAERIGGLPGLTAVIVITTGIFGAVAGPGLLLRAGVQDERAVGFALGVTSHAIGTARAFQISDRAGAFASVGMILNALLTVGLAPSALAIINR
jgi:putative effector of murein hydrolase